MKGRRTVRPVPPEAAAAADRIAARLKGNPEAAARLEEHLRKKVTEEKAAGLEVSSNDVVRQAITASGLSLGELARRTDVETSTLSRFMAGERGISLATFDLLALELGLRVVRKGKS